MYRYVKLKLFIYSSCSRERLLRQRVSKAASKTNVFKAHNELVLFKVHNLQAICCQRWTTFQTNKNFLSITH